MSKLIKCSQCEQEKDRSEFVPDRKCFGTIGNLSGLKKPVCKACIFTPKNQEKTHHTKADIENWANRIVSGLSARDY